jgi:hypothetical protein
MAASDVATVATRRPSEQRPDQRRRDHHAIAERVELRIADAVAVGDREVDRPEPHPRRLDADLDLQAEPVGIELHGVEVPASQRVQPRERVGRTEPREPVHRGAEEGVADPVERRDVLAAARPHADDHVVLVEHPNHLGDRVDRIRRVGIHDDDLLGLDRRKPRAHRRRLPAVAFELDDTEPASARDVRGPIRGPVVDDHDLDPGAAKARQRLEDHGQRPLLVECGRDHRCCGRAGRIGCWHGSPGLAVPNWGAR